MAASWVQFISFKSFVSGEEKKTTKKKKFACSTSPVELKFVGESFACLLDVGSTCELYDYQLQEIESRFHQ